MGMTTKEGMDTSVVVIGTDGGNSDGATMAPRMVGGETQAKLKPRNWHDWRLEWKPEKTPQEQADEKRAAVESLFGQTEVFAWTKNVYADVLTREFVAIQDLQNKGVVIGNPQVWHNRLNAAMDAYFSEAHKDTTKLDMTKDTREEQYQAYRTVFVKLLKSDNKEEAKEWLLMATQMEDRQKPAILASSQAHIDVVYEAEEMADVADYIAISPALVDSGISLDLLRTKIGELRKSMFRKIPIPVIGRFLKWLPATAAQNIIDTDKEGIQALWNRYRTEHSKGVYSSVMVDFVNGDTFNIERTIDGHELDVIQKQVLMNLPVVGQLTPGSALGAQGQKVVRELVQDMTAARANVDWVVLGTQRRLESHFTPVQPGANANEYITVNSSLPTRVVQLGGINIPISPDLTGGSPDDTLNALSTALDKRLQVKQGELYRERAKDVVEARVTELQKGKSEHTPAQTLRIEHLDETIKQLNEHKTLMTGIEKNTKEVQQKKIDVELQKTTLAEPLKWEEDIKKMTEAKAKKEKQIKDRKAAIEIHEKNLTARTAELQSSRTSRASMFTRVNPDPAAYARVDARIAILEGLIDDLNTKIDEAHSAQVTGNNSVDKLEDNITKLGKKLEPYTARLEAYKAFKKEVDEAERALALDQLRAEKSMGIVSVREIEKSIKQLTAEKGGITTAKDAVAEHERIALEAFKATVLDPEKLQAIRHRAREQKVDLYDTANNESIVAYTELRAAVENRVDVPPAYLQTMRIFMGSDALKATSNGKEAYIKFTHMLTPQGFLDHYMNDDPDTGGDPMRVALLMNAFFTAHGEQMPNNINVYDPRMQHDEIRSVMLQGVDRDFIQMLTDRMSQEANQGTLGVLDATDQQRIRTLQEQYIGNESAVHLELLQKGVQESVGPYAYSIDARVGRGIEEVRIALAQKGANLEQAPRVISYTHKLLQSSGSIQLADIHDGVNYTARGLAIETELTGLGIAVADPDDILAVINIVDSYSLASSDVQAYIQSQDAVHNAGIAIDKTDYAQKAVKRAMVHAGVPYGYTLQMTDVVGSTGALTHVGKAVQNELDKLGIALDPDKLVKMTNILYSSSVAQDRVEGMGEVVANIDPALHIYTDYISLAALRTIQEKGIDRSVAFVLPLDPAIKAKLQAELGNISINIGGWNDAQLISILEAARPENRIEHTDIADANQQVANLNKWLNVNSIFDPTSSSYDIIHSVSGAMRTLGITGSVNAAALAEQITVGGALKSRADALKVLINNKMGVGMSPAPTNEQLIALIDNVLPISTEPHAIRGEAHMLDMHNTLDIFFKHDGDYHNGTALALLLGGLDADTARQVSIAVETLVREKRTPTMLNVLRSITQPPREYVLNKTTEMIDGPNGIINKHNADPKMGTALTISDISLEWLRRNMADFASEFYQNRTNPIHAALAADQSSRFFVYANRLIDQADFPRMQTWFNTKYWGEQDPFLLAAAISADLGLMMQGQPEAVIRIQSLQLADAIMIKRGVKVVPTE